ncbi:MAG: FtsX-like permease family protein [Acidimicrobiia bacterium]|nr:FtsX-like permease family protein [Acidimicrobiia bacterium]
MIRWAFSIIGARARRDRVLLAATAVMVLISTILLAAGPMYSDAMSTAGLQSRITDAPPTESGIELEVRAPATALTEIETAVETAVETAGFPTAVEQRTITESASFAFPSRLGLDEKTRTVISYREGLEEAVTVIDGRHPSGPNEVVAHRHALERTGLGVGDQLELVTAGASETTVAVTIVGSVEPKAPTDPIWWGDELAVTGNVESGGFITIGPLWSTAGGFTTMLGDSDSVVGAQLIPDPLGIVPEEVAQLRSAATGIADDLEPALPEGTRLAVSTGLPDLLDSATSGLTVSRTTVVLTISQLAILSLYALVLAAGLLVESRSVETALLQSRGIDSRQLTIVSVLEGLLIVVPGVLLGPVVAMGLLGILDNFGPLNAAGLQLSPVISPAAMGFATIAGALCLFAMVGPARRQANTYMEVRSSQGRDRRAPIWQRTGLDIALVILAIVGLWQLRRYEGPLTSGASGQLSADPTLVAAPTIALLAGAVLSLRLIPLAGRIGERWARRSRSLAAPLGSRQIARRPVYHTRSALLLTMATTIGFFTASFSGTWTESQLDQASFAVPADFVVTPYLGPNRAFPSSQIAGAYGSVEGVASVSGVITANARSDQLGEAAQLAAISTGELGDGFSIRPDLVDRPLDVVREELRVDQYEPGMILPEDTRTITVSVSDIAALEPDQPEPPSTEPVRARVTLRDGSGLFHTIPLAGEPVGAETVELTADLRSVTDDVEGFLPPPAEIAGFEFDVPTPMTHELTIHEVVARSEDDQTTIPADAEWAVAPGAGVIYRGEPGAELDPAGEGWLNLSIDTVDVNWDIQETVTFRSWATVASPIESLPVIASRSLLTEGGYAVGDEATFEVEGQEISLHLVGVAESIPGLDPSATGILADAAGLQILSLQTAHDIMPPTQWHISLADGADAEIVGANLLSPPFTNRTVVGAEDNAESLLNDPLALGIIGSLIIGLIAALGVAVIGLTAASIVSARQRVGEFSLLQALGTSRREMARILTIENGFTILGSVISGIGLGLGLAWLALPSVSVSPSSLLVVPRPLVVIPWVTAALLIVGGLATMAILSAMITANFKHQNVAAVLRLGEDV